MSICRVVEFTTSFGRRLNQGPGYSSRRSRQSWSVDLMVLRLSVCQSVVLSIRRSVGSFVVGLMDQSVRRSVRSLDLWSVRSSIRSSINLSVHPSVNPSDICFPHFSMQCELRVFVRPCSNEKLT